MKVGVLLDRDGTINEQMGYINHLSRFVLFPFASQAIKILNDLNIPVAVVTNQSGLARGYFPEKLLTEVHEQMSTALAKDGAHVDGIYICPHHPEAKEENYRQTCNCRKPKIGLFSQAATELGLDLRQSFVIGDRWSDLKAARKIGAKGILVLTGYGAGDLQYIGPHQEVKPDYIATNLLEAVSWIIAEMGLRY